MPAHDIIDNQIYHNERGIYLYHSNDCELYCNDIYGNDPSNLTGIYLDYDYWNNIINFNNIYGNGWGVINDNPDGVDATNNWWGCSFGLNQLDGCESVSGYVIE